MNKLVKKLYDKLYDIKMLIGELQDEDHELTNLEELEETIDLVVEEIEEGLE